MKNVKAKLLQTSLIIIAMIAVSSCMNDKPADAKEVAEDHNDAKFESNKTEKDAQFLVNAAEINREEISLAQLAQKRGSSTHVKELGAMMENAHTKSLTDLVELASSKNITLPESQTEKSDKTYNKLSDKTNNDFDKAYADMMVDDHKDAISLFENASTESADPEIRAWATSSLTDLRVHLDHSINCQKECEKMQ